MTCNNLGAIYLGKGKCQFCVWAPLVQKVEVHMVSPQERIVPLNPGARGYHEGVVEDVGPGTAYLYRLDAQKERPDPASRYQPEGVHGPSQVIDPGFPWDDRFWHGIPIKDYILYELHVGTYTSKGTFEAIIPHLDGLKELGITALELMPVAQFPGKRNWGYDGVYPFAVQNSYGGPEGLKSLVNACHLKNLAVVMDVVYNHLGPEGNYLWDYGPYFTDRYKGAWGPAVNFDGAHSDEVRRFFIENALYWINEFHIDSLRIDAVHAIYDFSARPFLEELAMTVHKQAEKRSRRIYLIPESALNDTRLLRSRQLGGFGLDAQWNDDFHHALHTVLTGEQKGYYQDFGRLQDLSKACGEGFVYTGQYSSYRQRRHGNSSIQIPASRFVVFAQNHDQIGNRMQGERLSCLVSFEKLKLAAGMVLLSPFIPLLFMGEEYGEKAPFPYFISYLDADLAEAVGKGRQDEFDAFEWQGEPPDPQDEETFLNARLNHKLRQEGSNRVLFEFYKELIRLRKEMPALIPLSKEAMEVSALEKEMLLFVRRWTESFEAMAIFHFGTKAVSGDFPMLEGVWGKVLDSAEERWHGPGGRAPMELHSGGEVSFQLPPLSFVLFGREKDK